MISKQFAATVYPLRRWIGAAIWLAVAGAASAQLPPSMTLLQVREQMQAAFAQQDAHADGYGDNIRRLAAMLAKFKEFDEAIAALDRLGAAPETSLDVPESQRMKAQYLISSGNSTGALAQLQAVVSYYDTNPQIAAKYPVLHLNAINDLSISQAKLVSCTDALLTNERVLVSSQASKELRLSALLNKIAFLEQCGQFAQVVTTIDQLFNQFNSYGQKDGAWITLRMKKLAIQSRDWTPAQYISALEQLWSDVNARKYPQSLDVAVELVRQHFQNAAGGSAMDVAADALDVLDAERSNWQGTESSFGYGAEYLARAQRDFVSVLQSAHRHNRANLALIAWTRAATLTTDPATRAAINSHREHLQQLLASGTYP
jgi:hypothetical protein